MKLLNVNEAAAYLNMSETKLYEEVNAGRIPAAKPGKAWMFAESDLYDYFHFLKEEQKKPPKKGATLVSLPKPGS